MGFDGVPHTVTGFDPIGCYGTLDEELRSVFLRPPLEDTYELLADDLPLLFRIGDALQGGEELLRSILYDVVESHGLEHLFYFLGLPLPHQSVVHIDGQKPVADGLVHKGGCDHGVNSSGAGYYRFSGDLGPGILDRIVDEILSTQHLP